MSRFLIGVGRSEGRIQFSILRDFRDRGCGYHDKIQTSVEASPETKEQLQAFLDGRATEWSFKSKITETRFYRDKCKFLYFHHITHVRGHVNPAQLLTLEEENVALEQLRKAINLI